MCENGNCGGPDQSRVYSQEEVNELLRSTVAGGVEQSSSSEPQDLDPNDYPGIGVMFHLLHAVLTLITSGLWAVVWIVHVIVARSKWDKKIRQQYARKRRENKDQGPVGRHRKE